METWQGLLSVVWDCFLKFGAFDENSTAQDFLPNTVILSGSDTLS